MKKHAFYFVLAGLFIWTAGCLNSPVTGSDDVQEISNVEFATGEKTVTATSLTIKGKVKNTGSSKISPVWYIEGDFYADGNFDLKLGGDNQQFTFSLESDESAAWTLTFSSTQFSEADYPDFAVKNFRAYYK